jgi:3-methyladenine DNA glycosylase AlkC
VHDPSAHVRRLVSEGSRPRLPWGLRLRSLVIDPSPTLPLLRALQNDPSTYVRRSVANHLNDIAKDHPALLASWLAEHLPGASAERRALLRHASRGLLKQGDAAVLAAWGLGAAYRGRVALALSPERVVVGDGLLLTVQLHSTARQTQRLAVDYAVHHVKAAGHTTPKVFKGWVVELAPGESRQLVKRHSMKAVTTRRYHPGAHALDLRINGRVVARSAFELRA